ncbi:unnamed protein product [Moneuplotes crassus]|uniref:Uncharacterized protein n=1 Tax=Euplotes crassus TaxID=5936 RepID=A0AAD1UGA5_EUPCR|nr:unnamed protein product [Moneuplotes crassus]
MLGKQSDLKKAVRAMSMQKIAKKPYRKKSYYFPNKSISGLNTPMKTENNEYTDQRETEKEISRAETHSQDSTEKENRDYTSEYLNFLDKNQAKENSRLFQKVLNIHKDIETCMSELKQDSISNTFLNDKPTTAKAKKKTSTPSVRSPRRSVSVSTGRSHRSYVAFQAKPLNMKFIENLGMEIPLKKYINSQNRKQRKKKEAEYSYAPQKINLLRILPKKEWIEKNDQEREKDNQE